MFRIWFLLALATASFGQRNVVLENEFVRVVDVTATSTEKGRPHEHPMNRVMVYLSPGSQQLEYADGRKEKVSFRAGSALWSPKGGVHTSQNLGGPFRVIEVELLKRPGVPNAPVQLDPLKLAPRNYKVELDKPEVRVIRAGIDPSGQVPMHEHGPNRVAVFLTDAHLRVTDGEGKVIELKAQPGTVRWSGATKHREENLLAKPFEVLSIELR